MKQSVEVSVVIPCYNSERFIGRTLDSVLEQTLTNIEIIIVNDGSTDSSQTIIENVNDPRVRLINTINNGVSKARNIGLKEASGNYVLFLDSDDLIPSNYLFSSVETLSNNTVDFCAFPIVHINENDEIIKKDSSLTGAYKNVQFEIASFSKNISACPSAYVYNRKSLLDFGLTFNENLQSPEDRYFLLEVGRHLNGSLVQGSKLKYRVTNLSLSNNKNINLVKMQENYLNQVIKNRVIVSKKNEVLFIRKMCYQLFVDYFRFNKYSKSLVYFNKHVLTFIR